MVSLSFIRVSSAALTWIEKNRARFVTYIDGELSEAEDRKLMRELGLKPADDEPFDIEDAALESALTALGADGKIGSIVTMSPAAVKRVKLPEVFAEYDLERLFKGAAKRGDYMLIVIAPQLEEVREAPKPTATPKTDRAALLALLASRTQGNVSTEDVQRFRNESLDLAGVVLSGETLKGVLLWNADLSKADLSGTKLVQLRLEHANLEDANLRGATLDMPGLDDARLCRADLTNASFKNCSIHQADLSEVSAQGLKLSTYGGVDFRAKFCGADLRKARIDAALYDCDFRKANLAGAVMTNAQLLRSNFSGCDLSRADLTRAGLQNANLTGAIIEGARFEGATYTKKTKWPGDPPAGAVLVRK